MTDPTREQIDESSVHPDKSPVSPEIQLSNALYQRDDARRQRDQAERRIAELEQKATTRHQLHQAAIADLQRDCAVREQALVASGQQVQVLQDRIAKLRELADDRRAESVDGGSTDVDTIWPSEILAVLDGVPETPESTLQVPESSTSLVKTALVSGRDCAEDAVYDKPAEHFNLSREEWEAAAKARLDELGLTYAELAQMAADKHFTSTAARMLWVLIGGTLDADESGRNDAPVSGLSRSIPEPTGNNPQENANG